MALSMYRRRIDNQSFSPAIIVTLEVNRTILQTLAMCEQAVASISSRIVAVGIRDLNP